MVGLTDSVPPAGSTEPDHVGSWALVASQLVAFPLLHVSVVEPPNAMSSGSAPRMADTAEPTVSVSSTTSLVAPPAPVQKIE